MDIYLIDGTYELFRYFYAVPSSKTASGQEIGAVRGVLGSILTMIEGGATHIGVATDHVIESFRNDLYRDYKTGEGVDPELLSQFPILEEALQSMGLLVWPMIESALPRTVPELSFIVSPAERPRKPPAIAPRRTAK